MTIRQQNWIYRILESQFFYTSVHIFLSSQKREREIFPEFYP